MKELKKEWHKKGGATSHFTCAPMAFLPVSPCALFRCNTSSSTCGRPTFPSSTLHFDTLCLDFSRPSHLGRHALTWRLH